MRSSSCGQWCIHSATHSSRRLKPLSLIILPSQGYCWIGKSTNKKMTSCVMVLITRPSSTLKFQFVFGFNEYLWAIFLLLSFENFWFYILEGTFYFTTQMTLSHLLPMPINKNIECNDHQIYSKMLRKICKKEV